MKYELDTIALNLNKYLPNKADKLVTGPTRISFVNPRLVSREVQAAVVMFLCPDTRQEYRHQIVALYMNMIEGWERGRDTRKRLKARISQIRNICLRGDRYDGYSVDLRGHERSCPDADLLQSRKC